MRIKDLSDIIHSPLGNAAFFYVMHMIDKNKKFEIDGLVTESLPGADFKVKINVGEKDYEILAHLGGKMRMHYIKVGQGDKVKIEMTPYDLSRGRIIYRYR